jgi:mannose-6-phosphate isomerase-like protein (cupin superfamily)
MARRGDELVHPGTGERVVWRQVAEDTNGELLVGDMYAGPGAAPAAAHVHPHQEERFAVLHGQILLDVDGEKTVLGEGERGTVPQGRSHTWCNVGDDEAHVLVEIAPAMRSEMFFETLFGLARDGKTTRRGLPNLLSMAVIMREYDMEIRLARPSAGVQRALFTPLAMLGRRLGYRGWYPEYTADPIPRPPAG